MPVIEIRTLTADDLELVASVHIKAFSGRALSELGLKAIYRYYDWQLHGPHEAVCLGIFHESELAGFCFGGVFHGALSGFLRKNRMFLVWLVLTHPWLIFSSFFRDRISRAISILRRKPAVLSSYISPQVKSFGILSIAVDPKSQGLGLGKKLMNEAEQIALQSGFRRMHLTVDVDNVQAITFYEGLGWQKTVLSGASWRGSMIKYLGN